MSQPSRFNIKRRKTARAWQISLGLLQNIVKSSTSYAEVQRKLSLSKGPSYNSIKRRILHEHLDISHFHKKKFTEGGFKRLSKEEAIATLFNAYSLASPTTIRSYVKFYKLLPDHCSECPVTNIWNGKPIVLQLDHRDGNNLNHNLTNLRWLCPNCHSQTSTFSGKRKVLKHICLDCGSIIHKSTKSKKCRKCCQTHPTKIAWPADTELHKLVWSMPTIQLAKKLRVTDKAIERRCKLRDIIKPGARYWNQQKQPSKAPWPSNKMLAQLVWEMPTSQLAKQLGVSNKAVERRCKLNNISKPARGYWRRQACLQIKQNQEVT